MYWGVHQRGRDGGNFSTGLKYYLMIFLAHGWMEASVLFQLLRGFYLLSQDISSNSFYEVFIYYPQVLVQIQSGALNGYSIGLKAAQDKVMNQSLNLQVSAQYTGLKVQSVSQSLQTQRFLLTATQFLFRNVTMFTVGQRKVRQLSTQVDGCDPKAPARTDTS